MHLPPLTRAILRFWVPGLRLRLYKPHLLTVMHCHASPLLISASATEPRVGEVSISSAALLAAPCCSPLLPVSAVIRADWVRA